MPRSRVTPRWGALQRQRAALLRLLLGGPPLLVGSVYAVLRRCGNPSCHCATTPSHRQTLLLSTRRGRRRCQFIRREDEGWVREAWGRYRRCQEAVRQLRTLQRRELKLLRAQIAWRGVPYE